MSQLINAMRTRDSHTENGMVTNSSTLDSCVDLFFTIGAMRGQDKNRLIANFSKAFGENPLTAMKILFWARDARHGAGERQIFKDIISYLVLHNKETLAKNLALIPFFGRWDDLLVLFGTTLDSQTKELIKNALISGDGLCAKWMPRKGVEAIALERYMKLTPKQYRKLLVENTKVVEQLMCSKNWDSITYEKIPSLAMARYSKAFAKNDATRFDLYKNGDTKINAGAVYPYDILKTLQLGDSQLAVKQWASLPNWLEGSQERLLMVCDVSSSMNCPAGGNANLTCMDVCISLGLYVSERNEGLFKDAFISFNDNPQLHYLKGNLDARYRQLKGADWGGSTNLEGTFALVLNTAVANKLPASEMPTAILITSDMEFNSACRSNQTALDMIKHKYAKAGYVMPKIIFWNMQSRGKSNFPVQITDEGTALISGFSPAILKSVLSGENMSPETIMNKTVYSERYSPVTA